MKGRMVDNVKIDQVYVAGAASAGYDGTAQTMLDMRDYDGLVVIVVGTSVQATGTNIITGLNLVSNSASDGSGTDHEIAEAVTTDGGTTKLLAGADYGTAANTTVSDKLMALDVKADEMGAGDRYIAAVVTNTGTYPYTLIYIRYNGAHCFKDMIQATRTAFQYTGDL